MMTTASSSSSTHVQRLQRLQQQKLAKGTYSSSSLPQQQHQQQQNTFARAQDFYQQGMAAFEFSSLDEASQMLNSALSVLQELRPAPFLGENDTEDPRFGPKHARKMLHADVLLGLALIEQSARNFPLAKQKYAACITFIEENFSNKSALLVSPLLNLALIVIDQKQFDNAQSLLLRAKVLAEHLRDSERLLLADVYHNLGVVLEQLGRYDDASKHFDRSFHTRCVIPGGLTGQSGRMVIESLRSSSFCSAKVGDLTKSIRGLERAVSLVDADAADPSVRVELHPEMHAELLCDLADLYIASRVARHRPRAKKCYEQAVQVLTKARYSGNHELLVYAQGSLSKHRLAASSTTTTTTTTTTTATTTTTTTTGKTTAASGSTQSK